MKSTLRRIGGLLSLVVCISMTSSLVQASGAVYRWVDSQGNTAYGEHPPKGVNATLIKKASKRKSQHSTVESTPASTDVSNNDGKESSEGSYNGEKAQAKARKKNPEYCKRAKANLKMLTERARIRQRDKDGNVHYLTEKEVAEQKKISKRAIKDNC